MPNTTVCVPLELEPANQIAILEGDIPAVYVRSRTGSLPILSSLPASSGKRLYRDDRDFSDVRSSRNLRRSELVVTDDIGMHLYADIRLPSVTEGGATTASTQPPVPLTTVPSPTQASTTTTTQATTTTQGTTTTGERTLTPATTDRQETFNSTTMEQGMGNSSGGRGKVAAIVVVVLLLIGTSILVAAVLFVVYMKRRKEESASMFDCLKISGKNKTLLAIDNAMYRVGSQHIAPLFSKSPNHRKRTDTYEYPVNDVEIVPPASDGVDEILTSNNYDSPREVLDGDTYSIPTSLPATESVNYVNHTTIVTLEPSTLLPARASKGSIYQSPRGRSADEDDSGLHLDQKVESGDYIYMNSTCPDSEVGGEEKVSSFSPTPEEEEYIGPEEYQARLLYDSVQYRTLLQKATTDAGEEESPYRAPPSREDEIYIFISQQKIKVLPRHTITVTEVIGSGHFGEVDKGQWKSIKKSATLDVALKTLPSNRKTEDKIKLLQEAMVMGQFSHPNIVQLYGIVTCGDPLVLVMEYMAKQDLKKYLLKLKPQQGEVIDSSLPGCLLGFSEQVALGMHYLASKRLVHRDLAARNVLVSKDDVCKIGDFGMARDISDNGFYLGNDGKVPLKWTAPEAISLKKYSIASDVWSYGCLLYEIWSFGVKPFKGLKNEEAILKINSGYRLPPPPGCPKAIYTLMIQCWHHVSSSRPKYQAILTSLLENSAKVLHIPEIDGSSHSLACRLGSPLVAGLEMYPNLQVTYIASGNGERDPDYEYMDTDTDSDVSQ